MLQRTWPIAVMLPLCLGCGSDEPPAAPAYAPPASLAGKKAASGAPVGAADNAPGDPMPEYHWPDDFELPLEITIEPPAVPERIQGRTPMPGEDEGAVADGDRAAGDE
jgi:hypothetical protein